MAWSYSEQLICVLDTGVASVFDLFGSQVMDHPISFGPVSHYRRNYSSVYICNLLINQHRITMLMSYENTILSKLIITTVLSRPTVNRRQKR